MVTWQPVVLDFDRTIQPEGGHLHLAFHCSELSLLDGGGSTIRTIHLGGSEMPVEFGEGVYDIERQDGTLWRWFGAEGEQAVLLFAKSDLAAASMLPMPGHPFENGISAIVRRNGAETDSVTFRTDKVSETFELSLEP